jgi:hypothetical protein
VSCVARVGSCAKKHVGVSICRTGCPIVGLVGAPNSSESTVDQILTSRNRRHRRHPAPKFHHRVAPCDRVMELGPHIGFGVRPYDGAGYVSVSTAVTEVPTNKKAMTTKITLAACHELGLCCLRMSAASAVWPLCTAYAQTSQGFEK